MDGLPPELLQDIFHYVSKTDLHSLAHVCMRMRTAALSDERFFVTFRFSRRSQRKYDALEHAVANRVPLNVEIGIYDDRDDFRVDLLVKALPLVVRLSVSVVMDSWKRLAPALLLPVTMLQYFKLSCYVPGDTPHLYQLISNIFSGQAPRLRTVSLALQLANVSIPSVMRNATYVDIYSFTGTPLRIIVSRDFPLARRLELYIQNIGTDVNIDCNGARNLQRVDIIVAGDTHSNAAEGWKQLRIADTRVVTVGFMTPQNLFSLGDEETNPLLRGMTGPLALRSESSKRYLTIGSLLEHKQRMITMRTAYGSVRANIEALGVTLHSQLVDIEIDGLFFTRLLHNSPPASLPMLEHLRVHRIDEAFFSVDSVLPVIRCDQLFDVVLLDPAAVITSEFVAMLSGALGQDFRPPCDRARLELVVTRVSGVIIAKLNDSSFSEVRLNSVSRESGLNLLVPQDNRQEGHEYSGM